MSKQHIDLVKKVYAAGAEGDWDTLEGYLHPDFAVVEPDSAPYVGRFEGIEGFKEVFGIVFSFYDELTLDHRAFCSGDNHVMVLLGFGGKSKKTGESFEVDMIEMFEIKDDKLVEIKPFYFNTDTLHKMAP